MSCKIFYVISNIIVLACFILAVMLEFGFFNEYLLNHSIIITNYELHYNNDAWQYKIYKYRYLLSTFLISIGLIQYFVINKKIDKGENS